MEIIGLRRGEFIIVEFERGTELQITVSLYILLINSVRWLQVETNPELGGNEIAIPLKIFITCRANFF